MKIKPPHLQETAPVQCDPSPRNNGDRADSWGTGQRSLWHTGHSGHLTPPAGKHSGPSPGRTERSQCLASHSHKLQGERRRECAVNMEQKTLAYNKKISFVHTFVSMLTSQENVFFLDYEAAVRPHTDYLCYCSEMSHIQNSNNMHTSNSSSFSVITFSVQNKSII